MLTKVEMPVACSDNEPGVINSSVYAGGRKVIDVAIEEAGDWSKRPGHVVWIGLFEPSDELLKRVQQQFDLHPLAIEDAGKAHQHPKLEQYGDMFQIVHPDHLKDPAITQPILDMAAEIGAKGFQNEQHAIMARPDSRPLLVDIDVPTVVIVGRQDQSTPLARAEEMAADISRSRLVVLEECGHMSPLERPDEVTAELRRWLTE